MKVGELFCADDKWSSLLITCGLPEAAPTFVSSCLYHDLRDAEGGVPYILG